MLKDPVPEEELEEYLEQINAKQPDCKMDSCKMDNGNYKEPKPLTEEKSWEERVNAKWD